nr:NAD(P)-dependent glycerol-3-phosphate dehydrogenase [Acidobacteriota bacterium]
MGFPFARVAVIGAGSWGTTVASHLAHNAPTVLWARRRELADELRTSRTNSRYLPEHRVHAELQITNDIVDAVTDASLVVVAVPSSGFRDVVRSLALHLEPRAVLMSLTKGLERGTGRRMSEVLVDLAPDHPVSVLSGPNLAGEIAAGQPAASVVACPDAAVANRLQEVFTRPLFRVYTHDDVIGCEIGGVVKNVIAIAAGMAHGMGFGDNSRATLITRGLVEMGRLGAKLGANPGTFSGLAGMGDVIATCSSMKSRNTTVGVRLGKGETISNINASMNHMVAEGVKSAGTVVALARKVGVEMPITEAVAEVCEGRLGAADGMMRLMTRSKKSERE